MCQCIVKCGLMTGTRSAEGIMASGHANRANRPNTWLHRPMVPRDRRNKFFRADTSMAAADRLSGVGSRGWRPRSARHTTAAAVGGYNKPPKCSLLSAAMATQLCQYSHQVRTPAGSPSEESSAAWPGQHAINLFPKDCRSRAATCHLFDGAEHRRILQPTS